MTVSHDQIMDKYKKQLADIAKKSCLHSASRIPARTRKFSGQARASTNMSIGSVDPSYVVAANYERGAISGTGAAAIRRFQLVSSGIKLGDQVFITSSLPYIRHVEYKHGDLMFERTISDWKADVQRAVNDSR